MKDEIDALILSLYEDKPYTELSALSFLISKNFIAGLEAILNKYALNRKGIRQFYNVTIGWIDKIPLADFTSHVFDYNQLLINEKVEIGDILFITSHNDISNNREYYSASIIQAKVADIKHPLVPITKMDISKINATSKELALLSDWPIFDLYKTSKSQLPEINAQCLDIGKDDKKSKFMGYYEKSWHCGFPNYNEICKTSLGEHIKDIVKGHDGRSFVFGLLSSDWDRLINTILTICSSYNLPRKYYGLDAGTRLMEGDFLLHNFISSKCTLDEDYSLWADEERRLPVILIDMIQIEGEEQAKKYD